MESGRGSGSARTAAGPAHGLHVNRKGTGGSARPVGSAQGQGFTDVSPPVSAVYDVTLNFRGNKNPSLLGILYGKKYEADMCVR